MNADTVTGERRCMTPGQDFDSSHSAPLNKLLLAFGHS